MGKSYFGFTDEELKELDRWVRNHTVDSFGPVRQVEPKLVFEVAFDSVTAPAGTNPALPCAFRAFTGSAGTNRQPRPTFSIP